MIRCMPEDPVIYIYTYITKGIIYYKLKCLDFHPHLLIIGTKRERSFLGEGSDQSQRKSERYVATAATGAGVGLGWSRLPPLWRC